MTFCDPDVTIKGQLRCWNFWRECGFFFFSVELESFLATTRAGNWLRTVTSDRNLQQRYTAIRRFLFELVGYDIAGLEMIEK